MALRSVVFAVLLLMAAALAAQPSAGSCPANQPVDELIATLHKLHSKKANRNKNPLPEIPCIGGWCLKPKNGPNTTPEDITVKPPDSDANLDANQKAAIRNCEFALNDALHAAHNVEVGDQYFEKKNFRAASDRYSEALQQKPSDAAIHVRYARAAEQLGNKDGAKEHYATAVKLGSPKQSVDEASSALERLK